MKTLLTLVVVYLAFITYPVAYACTGFMASDDNRVLVGNNEDYNIPRTRMWFVPAQNGRYGKIYFGYENWRPQGGMNDQGLFFDFFGTTPLAIKQSRDKPKFRGDIIDKFMSECATVKEVLDLFDNYNLEFMRKFQMLIVDKTGDSAIIEGDDIIRKTGTYQVVTNFHQSRRRAKRQACRWYEPGCLRYQIAENMLKTGQKVSVEHFREILGATHQHTLGVRTLYSNIYDLQNGLVYLYFMHNFDSDFVIDLDEELKKGGHYYEIPHLFGKGSKYSKKKYVHPSPLFTISYPEHYKVVEPKLDEVFRVKCSFSGTPILSVSIDDKPQDIPLKDIGVKFFGPELEKLATDVKIAVNTQSELYDGTAANEMHFDWVTKENWPVKTIILSTYRDEKLIYAAVHALAHPDSLREYLYSLKFD